MCASLGHPVSEAGAGLLLPDGQVAGDREELAGGEPVGEGAAVVFDEVGDSALDAGDDAAVHHDRAVLGAPFAPM
jgi:hypothetical protein